MMNRGIESNGADSIELMFHNEGLGISAAEGQYVHYSGLIANVEGTCTDIDSLEDFVIVTALGND